MHTLKRFRIKHRISGIELGVFEGANESEALDSLARGAGYKDYQDACLDRGKPVAIARKNPMVTETNESVDVRAHR